MCWGHVPHESGIRGIASTLDDTSSIMALSKVLVYTLDARNTTSCLLCSLCYLSASAFCQFDLLANKCLPMGMPCGIGMIHLQLPRTFQSPNIAVTTSHLPRYGTGLLLDISRAICLRVNEDRYPATLQQQRNRTPVAELAQAPDKGLVEKWLTRRFSAPKIGGSSPS